MNRPKTSALRHLTSVFGDPTQVEHLAAALRTAAEHHSERAGHLRTRREAGHLDGPNSHTSRDGRRRLADGALAPLLLDHMNTYPGRDFSPYDLAKALGHSHAAIRTRLLALADTGEVVRTRIRPARFQVARPAS